MMIGLSVYCWQHARLTVDFLLAGFCLALPFTFDALFSWSSKRRTHSGFGQNALLGWLTRYCHNRCYLLYSLAGTGLETGSMVDHLATTA